MSSPSTLRALLRSARALGMNTDLSSSYKARYYYKPGVDPLTLTVHADTWTREIWNVSSAMAYIILTMSYLYIQLATFSVLLGGGQPKDWPPFYGSITEAYTVRRFWNTFWHQLTRHLFVAYSRDLRDMFRIRRGTWLSSYFELYFSFFLSALFHGLITYAMPYRPGYTFNLRYMMWFNFMFWQASAIQFEDFVRWCYMRIVGEAEGKVRDEEQKRLETKATTWHTVVGYIWVFGWWYCIMPWPADAFLKLGVIKATPLPFSVLEPIVTWAENANARSG